MGTKTKKKHPVMQKLGLSILTVLIVTAIVFTTYYFTLNKEDSKYINQLYKYKVEVDKSNNSVADAVKNIDNIDVKNSSEIDGIKSTISNAVSDLENVLQDLQQLRPPAKYKLQYDNFTNGIFFNKRIFMQANLIIKNPRSNKLKSATNDLSSYISNASKAYDLSKLKKASITLPNGIVNLSDNVNNYAFNIYNDYEARNQSLEQYTAYFKSMDDVITMFNNSKEDLGINLNLIKTNTLSMDDVYTKIEGDLTELNQIQTSYNALSVPPKMGSRHKQFNDIIQSYIYYCQDFKTALNKYEEAGSDTNSQNDVNLAFSDLAAKYKLICTNLSNYQIGYNNDKAKYSDINNL